MLIDSVNVSYLDELLCQVERIRQIVEEKNFENPYQIINEIRNIFEGLDNIFYEKDRANNDLLKLNNTKDSCWNWISGWLSSMRASCPVPRKQNSNEIFYKPEILKRAMLRFIDKSKGYKVRKYIPLSFFVDSVKFLINKGFSQFDLFLLKFEDRVGYFLAFLELYKNNIIELKQKKNFIIFKSERL
ncbi:chromosome segregation and condensation protein ScpA [Thermodesulfobium narugense DSM 14796]|uniref:Chromosome segregation and condensation protein ScpA n=1 Tax=Thermodesulfobium narugense DSM 14796 TaxID=747365 RepID=M1E573_9BACT|nr:chromosome segregation and condensation protein ScpA [Thermodesulfobium narugense]AEE14862.1 chromosome segregation and condensation protein ScpA [Thermodesulfobium narugense DSM 14796]